MRVLGARVVAGDRVLAPGWVEVSGERIAAVGAGRPVPDRIPDSPAISDDGTAVLDLGDATIVPGFVDVHVHGGGGASFSDGTAEAVRIARGAHLASGTTTMLASLVADSREALLAQVAVLASCAQAGEIAGIHLEGPWLSPQRAGAHDPAHLRAPDPTEIDELLDAGAGQVRMVTIAPELPGALDAIRRLSASGVHVAVGHTEADDETTRAAIDAGARGATHLFNAMRPLDHRAPGPILALLEDERVAVELIADGVHLHPAIAAAVERSAGPLRTLFVSDAMAAAACGDGGYRLGGLSVDVRDGVARLAGTDTVAGSTATMADLFRTRVSADPALVSAVRLTAGTPARVLSLSGVGAIAPGMFADLVALDADSRVTRVMHRGRMLG